MISINYRGITGSKAVICYSYVEGFMFGCMQRKIKIFYWIDHMQLLCRRVYVWVHAKQN